jgi:Rho guanine nucleotide exchange factor 7
MENTIVQADFSFKGSNNDELCFKKGDLIVLTNRDEDGAWWEGTTVESGITGWFPSNYVSEYKTQPPTDVVRPPEEIQAFRSVVYNDLLDSERAHCAELRGLLENFLEPLETSQM